MWCEAKGEVRDGKEFAEKWSSVRECGLPFAALLAELLLRFFEAAPTSLQAFGLSPLVPSLSDQLDQINRRALPNVLENLAGLEHHSRFAKDPEDLEAKWKAPCGSMLEEDVAIESLK